MKIFNVGLPKTGTSTLAGGLRILGYKCVHDVPEISDEYDAYSGLLTVRMHTLPQKDNIFIWTHRPLDSWITSCERHFSNRRRAAAKRFRMEIFGVNEFHRETFIKAYKKWNDVWLSFKKGNDKCYELNFMAGDAWPELCKILSKPIPEEPFPHLNRKQKDKVSRYPK